MSIPSIYQLKPAFQKLLSPVVNQLASWGVTPNQVTIAAIALSILTGSVVALWHEFRWTYFLVPLALFMRMALNAIDGMIAREHNMKTPLGAILNELGDVLSDAALYLPFALIPGISGQLIVPVVILAIISEMAGVLGNTTGGQRRYDGPMGKSDRALVFGTISFLLALGVTARNWLDLVWIAMIVLLAWTIINRVRGALQ